MWKKHYDNEVLYNIVFKLLIQSFVRLELEFELLVHGDASVPRAITNTTRDQTRGAIVEEGISKNGIRLDINAEHSLLSEVEVEVDVKTLWVAGGDLWGVLGIVAGLANLNSTAALSGGDDLAVFGGVTAEVLDSVLFEDIEPDDGARAESAVSQYQLDT